MGLLDGFRRFLSKLWSEPKRRTIEHLVVPRIQFVGEQDGPVESELKAELGEWFRRDGRVVRAYLARGELGEPGNPTVVLGLRATPGSEEEIVAGVRSIFASKFARDEHLDTMFLDDEMAARIGEVCSPFFTR